jgi:lactate permease
MWQPNTMPIAGSLGWSTVVAAIPIGVVIYLLGVKRTAAWVAALSGLAAALLVALFVYRMPSAAILAAISYGTAFGLFPVSWIVVWAIMLYRLTLETGRFEILKDSIGGLTNDRRLQALLIAFAFGAFLEGAAGFGAPVAVAAAMLAGLGFSRFEAAGLCLLANTAPVAFGSIGIPIITLAGVTGLPLQPLSAWVGRICAPVSVFIPAYLILVMGGWSALKGVLPAAVLCGVTYAGVQWLVSNFIGPQLTDIFSSLAAIGTLLVLFKLWKPADGSAFRGATDATAHTHYDAKTIFAAWTPYLLLIVLVFVWGLGGVKSVLDRTTVNIAWPLLHDAKYKLNLLTASGTACLAAVLLSALFLRVGPRQFANFAATTFRQLALPVLTIVLVLSFAFLMNYSGATTTLGLAFASTGRTFPFFSPLLGWLGVFLVGSDTSSNALFGPLQTVTAARLGFDPALMAAANSSGGVMGKMISLSSIAVAVAATGLPPGEEARLFRFTLKHSLILAGCIGVIVAIYAS